MRPEHSETKAKTRDQRVQNEDRDQPKSETETETSLDNSVAYENKTNRYAFIVHYIFEIIKMNNP